MTKNRKFDHSKISLSDALKKHLSQSPVSFHVPGHKNGSLIPKESSELLGKKVYKLDKTEISGLDNLHHAEGVIKESQELLADAYGVLNSYFLVGGSTSGILSSILTFVGENEKIIVSRDCHKSVISGIILTGAIPVFVEPSQSQFGGVLNPCAFDFIKNVIDNNSDAKVILITSPNYFGLIPDVSNIASYAKKMGIPIIVDEAHGAHLYFSKLLPKSAVEFDVDIVIQSAHKTLPALTQGSFLHVLSEKVNTSRLEQSLQMVQTSSPSYPIMTSLEAARKFMVFHGEKALKKIVKISRWIRAEINKIPGFKTYTKPKILDTCFDYDETKVFFDTSESGFTGYEISNILADSGIYVELATSSLVLLILSVASKMSDAKRLIGVLSKIIQKQPIKSDFLKIPDLPKMVMSPREAFYSKRENVSIVESTGRVASDTITVYPPGIPIIVPGEIVSEESISYLEIIQKSGGSVTGVRENKISVVKD